MGGIGTGFVAALRLLVPISAWYPWRIVRGDDVGVIRKDLRVLAVLVAAYALVLHTLIMGFAGPVHAATDTFVICSIDQAGSADSADRSTGHATMPDCCLSRGPILPEEWGGSSLPVIFASPERLTYPVAYRDRVPSAGQDDHAPMMARAPPSVA